MTGTRLYDLPQAAFPEHQAMIFKAADFGLTGPGFVAAAACTDSDTRLFIEQMAKATWKGNPVKPLTNAYVVGVIIHTLLYSGRSSTRFFPPMKQLLLTLLLLTPSAGNVTAAQAPVHHYARRHHASPRTAPAQGQAVYLCDNGKTIVYHSSTDCPAMRRCTHQVRSLSVSEAKASGHRECMKCY